MIITHGFKYFKIDVSGENAFPPSADINCTLLKRMQAGTRAHAQPSSVQLLLQFASASSSSSADS